MTEAQNEEWREWGVAYVRKVFKANKVLAEKECYGLIYNGG